MSYVLDALKKAEAERDPNARANLAIEHRARHRQRLLGYGVIAALLANAVVFVWLFYPDQIEIDNTSTSEVTSLQTPSSQSQPPPIQLIPRSEPDPQVPITEQSTPDNRSAAVPQTIQRLSRRALPTPAAARFPDLDFSTHIYAEQPDLRALVVNGQRLEEGDHLGALTLLEITETGAILAFERYEVVVDVLDDWD